MFSTLWCPNTKMSHNIYGYILSNPYCLFVLLSHVSSHRRDNVLKCQCAEFIVKLANLDLWVKTGGICTSWEHKPARLCHDRSNCIRPHQHGGFEASNPLVDCLPSIPSSSIILVHSSSSHVWAPLPSLYLCLQHGIVSHNLLIYWPLISYHPIDLSVISPFESIFINFSSKFSHQ